MEQRNNKIQVLCKAPDIMTFAWGTNIRSHILSPPTTTPPQSFVLVWCKRLLICPKNEVTRENRSSQIAMGHTWIKSTIRKTGIHRESWIWIHSRTVSTTLLLSRIPSLLTRFHWEYISLEGGGGGSIFSKAEVAFTSPLLS